MYSPLYSQENDQSIVLDFIKQHPFAIVCACNKNNKPVATQIPFLVDERDGKLILTGHIQKQTDHHLALVHNPSALVIFAGSHAYISASWYTNPQVASTWNYITVQAKGNVAFVGEEALVEILKRTTAYFENNPASPALVEKMPGEYVAKLSKAIVGFEIVVQELQHTFKLSQNRDAASYKNIIDELKKTNDPGANEIAGEMEKRQYRE